jgi:hypothetical protein
VQAHNSTPTAVVPANAPVDAPADNTLSSNSSYNNNKRERSPAKADAIVAELARSKRLRENRRELAASTGAEINADQACGGYDGPATTTLPEEGQSPTGLPRAWGMETTRKWRMSGTSRSADISFRKFGKKRKIIR